jgi:hypothetical protein
MARNYINTFYVLNAKFYYSFSCKTLLDDKCGGRDRNRTDVQGFAILCMTTLPPGQAYVYAQSLIIDIKGLMTYSSLTLFLV